MSPLDLLTDLLNRQDPLILDGGLATTLESLGHDLDDDLWSARLLLVDPDAIRQVHTKFLEAGADCIVASTYQASLPGFRARGLDDEEGARLLRRSVEIALEARDAFWSDPVRREGRLRPLVAASVGPYGAFLADGSEYTGDYPAGRKELYEFHRERWSILAGTGADLLACETIPSRIEADVLLQLLRDSDGPPAWVSFSCRDGRSLSDGSPFADVVRACAAVPRAAAIGVNCTPPQFVASLLREARRVTAKPLIAYPNAGERYDAAHGSWTREVDSVQPVDRCREWVEIGAAAVGGCCRVGPEEIREIRRQLVG